MKLQEIWSQTYNHLWHATNTTLMNAPTISRHLARTLVSVIPEDGMSAIATRLHCQKCSALMTNAQVRLRKLKKRSRRADRQTKNQVIRVCPACGYSNVEKGGERAAPSETALEELAELRKRIEKQRKKATEGSMLEDKGKKGAGQQAKEGLRPVIDGRIKKKKKKKKKRGSLSSAGNERNAAPKTGLAASFLFDPVP